MLVVLGLCGFLFSLAISFQSLGMGQGLEIGDAELEQYRISRGEEVWRFSGGGQNTHQRMASDYWAISISFVTTRADGGNGGLDIVSKSHLQYTSVNAIYFKEVCYGTADDRRPRESVR